MSKKENMETPVDRRKIPLYLILNHISRETGMPSKRSLKKKRKRGAVGIEAIVEPGYGAIAVRGPWMKKLDDLGKWKKKMRKMQRK